MSVDPNVPKPPLAKLALNEHDALPAGTRFGEFEIIRALGVGGFGIVYLAQDHSLERPVALKEYMPASLAARGAGAMITIRSSKFAETYAIGLRSFVNEARLLARFDHPSLVKVYRFWEDNGTAYMVMPYLQGRTLRDARRTMSGPPDELWIRSVLDPLLDALELLHGEGVFHRDIAPDNILLTPAGSPILLDFGAARRVISDRTQSLTAILKPSYAPIEQYAEMAAMRQGPWTDIYALGAVLHYLLFGVPPAPATARAVQPDAEQIEQRVVAGVSPRFTSVVAWMLGVRPLERPQNVASVRAALDGSLPVPLIARHEVTRPVVRPVAPEAFDPTAAGTPFSPTVWIPRPSSAAETMLDTVFQATESAQARGAAQGLVSVAGPANAFGRDGATVSAPVPGPSALATTRPAVPPRVPGIPPAYPHGVAPMRSTPPGTAPPAYVPGPRLPKAAPVPVPMSMSRSMSMSMSTSTSTSTSTASAGAAEDALAAGPQASRRGRVVAGALGAVLLAAVVLWQIVGVLGRPRLVRPSPVSLAASAGAASAVRSVATASSRASIGATTAQIASVLPWAAGASSPTGPTPSEAVSQTDLRASNTGAALAPQPVSVPAPAQPSAPQTRRERIARIAPPIRREPSFATRPQTVREACGDRSFISLAMCIDRQCEQPRFRQNPECVRMQEAKRQRGENY